MRLPRWWPRRWRKPRYISGTLCDAAWEAAQDRAGDQGATAYAIGVDAGRDFRSAVLASRNPDGTIHMEMLGVEGRHRGEVILPTFRGVAVPPCWECGAGASQGCWSLCGQRHTRHF
jgi:hypothetical protein